MESEHGRSWMGSRMHEWGDRGNVAERNHGNVEIKQDTSKHGEGA